MHKIPKDFVLLNLHTNFCWHVLAQENADDKSTMKASHIGLYLYIVNLNRKIRWDRRIGLPTTKTMKALGIKSDDTYYKLRNELVVFGLLELKSKSTKRSQASIFTLDTARFQRYKSELRNKEITEVLIKAHG